MLTSDRVVDYVKRQFGFPFEKVELTDQQIEEYLQNYTLKELSYYIPHVKKTYLSFSDPDLIHAGRPNERFLTDDEGLEIMNVIDIYFNRSDFSIMGHPFFGSFSMGDLKNWALSVETSMMIKQFSDYDYTFEFKHPNILRVSPLMQSSSGGCTVEYETVQPPDFSGIPNDLQMIVQEFCAADIMIIIGRIRRKYGDGNLRTPFGEIPLGSDVYEEGKEKKREIIDKLQMALPNVSFDFA